MPEPATISDADEQVVRFLRESGVLREIQQQALEVNLRQVANSQGFELLHMSHRHHPVVEFSIHMGELDAHRNPVRLRSEVCRLPRAASVRVSASRVFARYRRAVVRVVCVPEWD